MEFWSKQLADYNMDKAISDLGNMPVILVMVGTLLNMGIVLLMASGPRMRHMW